MSVTTAIEWTDATVNPIRARNIETGAVGHFCEKVSPGCGECYASAWNERVRPIASKNGGHLIGTGLTFDVRNRSKVEIFLDESKLLDVLKCRTPKKWFWCDMTDLFGAWVPDASIDRCFAVMALTPWHTHQVLTKRADRMLAYMNGLTFERVRTWMNRALDGDELRQPTPAGGFVPNGKENLTTIVRRAKEYIYRDEPHLMPLQIDGPPFKNVWLGVSVEDQQRADERIPQLLQTPAAVRFLSCEPLLGPVNLTPWIAGNPDCQRFDPDCLGNDGDCHDACEPGGLHWVIVGGESGGGARPFGVAWARSIVGQCKAAGVACFVKQLGQNVRDRNDAGFDGCGRRAWPVAIEQRDAVEDNPNGFREEWQGAEVRVRLVDRKGGDPAEWPPDLRVREWPGAR